MSKKISIVALITAVALVLPAMPWRLAARAETIVPASVSGYVSKENGSFTLASRSKTPVVYVDGEETRAVLRAADDLCSDIEKVTGVVPAMEHHIGDGSFTYADGILTMTAEESYDKEGTGIVAVYNGNGTLSGMAVADRPSRDGRFTFSKEINVPEKGYMKGFIWDSLSGMNPLTSPVYQGGDISNLDVIVGTVGDSRAIDTLVSSGKLDVSDIEGKWESFKTTLVDDTLVIAGSDKRGTIYGMYDLSEKIGVSPWYWWADVPVGYSDALYITLNEPYVEGEPSVKFRGIFLNDEQSLKNYAFAKGDKDFVEVYERVFELLLRLKANYLWPAMHDTSPAFHQNDINSENADKYGIVMGSSHCEMFLRNNAAEFFEFEADWEKKNPDKPLYKKKLASLYDACSYIYTAVNPDTGEAVYNKEIIRDYWKECLEKYGKYDNIYNVGMRGIHDETWAPVGVSTVQEKAELLEEIITMQRELIKEVLGKEPEDVPQLFIPYKEIQEIYDSGMDIPDDITLMWTDDNYGYIRQVPTSQTYDRSGGAGIYYHLSYHGSPKSYLWLNTTPLGLIREQMTKAYDSYAKDVWVANVGDLKPAENEIEYFLDLARDINVRSRDLKEYTAQNARRDFGFSPADAEEYADIALGFDRLGAARKPELYTNDLFAYTAFGDEGQNYVDQYESLVKRSEALYDKVEDAQKPAFFELQLYPLRSCYNTAKKYINADKSNLYFEQGRGAAVNKYAQKSKEAYNAIVADTAAYNQLLDGKWDRIMDPFQDHWSPTFGTAKVSKELKTSTVEQINYTQMGVAAEEMKFSGYSKDIRFIDLYNTGSGSFEWRITSDKDWVQFHKTSGTVYSDERIWTGLDWERVPAGNTAATITVSQIVGDCVIATKDIPIEVKNDTVPLPEKTYAEANGIVSMEAEHYSSVTKSGEYCWQVEEGSGRSGDGLKAYPNFAPSVENPDKTNSSYVDYKIYFESAGTFDVEVYRMPTLNERGGTRFGVALDDDAPVILTGTKSFTGGSGTDGWSRGVMANNETLTTKITVPQAGIHTFRVYTVDPCVVLDKIVITTGTKTASYFGAPESYNSTYNNIAPQFPAAKQETEEEAEGEFCPEVLSVSAELADNTLSNVKFVKVGSAHDNIKVTAAVYGANGAMLRCETQDVPVAPYALKESFDVSFHLALSDATSVGIVVYDSAETMQVLAPFKTFTLEEKNTEAPYHLSFKQSLVNYKNKQSMVLVTPYGSDTVVYIGQEQVGFDSYKAIPFDQLNQEKYTVKVGIYGGKVFEKTIYTVENYQPDNNGAENVVYMQGFDQDIAEDKNIALSGTAQYHAGNKNIKMTTGTSGGEVRIIPGGTLGMVQGQKISVLSDIAYGKLSGKYMEYKVLDSKGAEILKSRLCAYTNESSQSLSIGGEEFLLDGKMPAAITADNTAMNAGYVRYHTVIDPAAGSVAVTVTNSKNSTVSEYRGILPNGVEDIGAIVFSSDYNNSSRSCYIDNVSINTIAEPQYGITIRPLDKNSQLIENGQVTVTDAVYGTEIAPAADGRYMLCEGTYNYSVLVGDQEKTGGFDVFGAMESNQIDVKFDVEYTNKITVNVTEEQYSENEDESLYDWDFTEDQTGTGNNVPALSGGAYYDLKYGSVSLSAASEGGLDIQLEPVMVSGTTHKAVVEFDMAFSKQSGKSSYYTLYDEAGNELIKLSCNEYNNSSANQKLDIGGVTAATGGGILNYITSVTANGMTGTLTHFKNVLDFDTGVATVSISSDKGSVSYSGKLANASGDVARLLFTSNHTNTERVTHADNIKFHREAVPVKKIMMESFYEGAPAQTSITITNIETGASALYIESGLLLRAGSYRYTAQAGEDKTTGTFIVEP